MKLSNTKRLILLVMIVLAAIVPTATILAYTYRASISVTETAGTAYVQLPIMVTSPNIFLATNGFMTSTALDTRVETLGGLLKPHMVAGDRTLFVESIPANSQVNEYFTTGNTALTQLEIITGYNGSGSIPDAAALELGTNFAVDFSGYINTDAGAGKYIANKASAWTIDAGTTLAGRITVTLPATSSGVPAAQDAVATDAGGTVLVGGVNWAAMPFVANPTYYVTSVVVVGGHTGSPGTVTVRVEADNAGAPSGVVLDSGTFNGNAAAGNNSAAMNDVAQLTSGVTYWIVVSAASGGVGNTFDWTADSVTLGSKTSADSGATWLAGDLAVSVTVNGEVAITTTLSTISASAVRVVSVQVSAQVLSIYIGGVLQASTAVTHPVLDNASPIGVGAGNVMPYMDYFKITVGGTLIAHYQPVTMIRGATYSTGTVTVTNGDATVESVGTTAWTSNHVGSIFVSADGVDYVVSSVTDADTLELTAVYGGGTLAVQAYNMYVRLPDRQGTAQDARITWGANPAGITPTLGGMVSTGQSGAGGTTVTPTPQSLIPVTQMDREVYQDPDVSGVLLNNPFRPFVRMLIIGGGMTEIQAWRWMGSVLVVLAFVATLMATRGHVGIAGIAAGVAIVLLVATTVYPWFALFIAAVIIAASLVAERSPSV